MITLHLVMVLAILTSIFCHYRYRRVLHNDLNIHSNEDLQKWQVVDDYIILCNKSYQRCGIGYNSLKSRHQVT